MRLLTAAALLLAASSACAEGFAGIELGAPRKVLDAVRYDKIEEQTKGDMYIVSYRLPNNNVLSVNFDVPHNRVIFMEYDWGGTSGGTPTGVKSLRFGGTTINELAQTHGSKGFVFRDLKLLEDQDEVITFNGYPLKHSHAGVVVFISKMPLHEARAAQHGGELNVEALSDQLKLDAIVVADSDYIDDIWGEERVYDTPAPAVSW